MSIETSGQPSVGKLAERSAALKWGTFVVLLLGSQVAIGVVALILAGSDPSVVVVPGYHKKSLLWDESVHMRQVSRSLGWDVQFHLSAPGEPRVLTWSVVDRDGNAISNIKGHLFAYHHARAGQPIDTRVEDQPVGLALDREGMWQVEMTLVVPGTSEPFFTSQTISTWKNRS